jgi:hypothetical protein
LFGKDYLLIYSKAQIRKVLSFVGKSAPIYTSKHFAYVNGDEFRGFFFFFKLSGQVILLTPLVLIGMHVKHDAVSSNLQIARIYIIVHEISLYDKSTILFTSFLNFGCR